MHRVVLSIAGSDSGGGAGIQADLKTFHQLGVFGTSAVTLVTAQNSLGVRAFEPVTPELLEAQIDAVCSDFPVVGIKTGALGSAALVQAAVRGLARGPRVPLVVDPVVLAKSGDPLLDADGVVALRRLLLPRAFLITPNLPEAEWLLGEQLASESKRERAARAFCELGAGAALIKGGHETGPECADLLYDGRQMRWYRAPRIETRHTHGTGCTYSAAITAYLARGDALPDAVARAHAFVGRAIAGAPGLGAGSGPLDHWAGESKA